MCVGIVAACKNVQHVSAWCLWGPEESIRSPRPRVEPPTVCHHVGSGNQGSLEELLDHLFRPLVIQIN